MQSITPNTETVMKRFMGYTDGYAIRVNANIPVYRTGGTTTNTSLYIGNCVTSQLHGESCFIVAPRSGTDQATYKFYAEDVISVWRPASQLNFATYDKLETSYGTVFTSPTAE